MYLSDDGEYHKAIHANTSNDLIVKKPSDKKTTMHYEAIVTTDASNLIK